MAGKTIKTATAVIGGNSFEFNAVEKASIPKKLLLPATGSSQSGSGLRFIDIGLTATNKNGQWELDNPELYNKNVLIEIEAIPIPERYDGYTIDGKTYNYIKTEVLLTINYLGLIQDASAYCSKNFETTSNPVFNLFACQNYNVTEEVNLPVLLRLDGHNGSFEFNVTMRIDNEFVTDKYEFNAYLQYDYAGTLKEFRSITVRGLSDAYEKIRQAQEEASKGLKNTEFDGSSTYKAIVTNVGIGTDGFGGLKFTRQMSYYDTNGIRQNLDNSTTIPIANVNVAGLMSAEMYNLFLNMQSDIDNLKNATTI
jgi:hypothetical protein